MMMKYKQVRATGKYADLCHHLDKLIDIRKNAQMTIEK